jgi:nitrite reductase/ring-hydroxylating ferredoxin subunit
MSARLPGMQPKEVEGLSPHTKSVSATLPADGENRRGFLERSIGLGVIGALVASYGTFAAFALRFLYPSGPDRTTWLYLAQVADIPQGGTLNWQTPAGAKVAVARLGQLPEADSFVALSSTCPHLGCQVHWEAQNNRFFCPCHNGAFDPTGKGIEGPPKGMSLARYPLKVRNGLLYIQTPTESLPRAESSSGLIGQRAGGCQPGCACRGSQEERA